MTDRTDSVVPQSPEAKSLQAVFTFSGIAIAIFALNLFALQPVLIDLIGPRSAQFGYILIRIAALVWLARALAKNAKRNRFQVLSTVLLVGFIDQVVLKGIWVRHDMGIHPADWEGIEKSSVFITMAMGYLFFIPIVLILAFVGMESIRFRRDWKI